MFEAYNDLSGSRGYDFVALSPIRLADLAAWLDFRGIMDSETREFYLDVICRVDFEYRKWLSNQDRPKPSGR